MLLRLESVSLPPAYSIHIYTLGQRRAVVRRRRTAAAHSGGAPCGGECLGGWAAVKPASFNMNEAMLILSRFPCFTAAAAAAAIATNTHEPLSSTPQNDFEQGMPCLLTATAYQLLPLITLYLPLRS